MIPEKMRAGVVVKPGEIVVREVEVPEVSKDEVLIKVKYCGVCGTDLHIYDGSYSAEFLPLIPGHEFVGHIAKVGSDVKDFAGGEKVIVDINLGCGKCYYCKRNQVLMCKECKQIGIHTNGGFAEYIAVPAHKVIRIPDDMPMEKAALVEPVSCIVRTHRKSGLTFAKSVAIIGVGSIGLMHLQMAKNCGAAPIIAIDRSPKRLEIAKQLGADFTIVAGDNDDELVRKYTDGRGADYVIESVGSMRTYDNAFKMVRPGGHIVAFGLADATHNTTFNPFNFVFSELAMTGTCAGMGLDFEEALTMVRYGRFVTEPFTECILPLEKISEAFDKSKNDMDKIKVIVSMY